jgi:Mn2+/Fe2+ NRAMP family transporter
VGLSLITGAADDDPSAVATYASAGSMFGPGILWTAPALFPMRAVVVYLASKLGQASGQGLVGAIKTRFPRWVLIAVAIGAVAGNTVEAAADLGGIAAALNLLVPVSIVALVVIVAAIIMAVQWYGSYTWIRAVFRWLALVLVVYVVAAIMMHPAALSGARAAPLRLNRDYFAILVALVGASLSPYLYIWQASQEVEEDVSMGRRRLSDRKGTTKAALRSRAGDVLAGMAFSSVVMYCIILTTASTLYPAGAGRLSSAAEAARALQPLAGPLAGLLFALGVIGVGFLAVPVMTVGAAYVVCDACGWKSGLSARPRDAKQFYFVIAATTVIAVAINFLGANPMHTLVAAGVVQGMLAPGLLLLMMLMTSNRALMGGWSNSRAINVLGWATTGVVSAAAVLLIVSAVAQRLP